MPTTLTTPLIGSTVMTTGTAPSIGKLNMYDATSGPLTATLPALSGLNVGARLALQKYSGDSTSNLVTINCAGSDTFVHTGTTSVSLKVTGEQRELQVIQISTTKYWALVGCNTPITSLDTRYQAKDTVFTITDGAAFEINPSNGAIQTVTLGANRTPKATNFTSGQSVVLHVAATSYTLTWTDSTLNPTWVGLSAPSLSATQQTVVVLWKVGSTMFASLVGYA